MIRTFDMVRACQDQATTVLFDKSPIFWHLYHAAIHLGPDPSGIKCNEMTFLNVSKMARKLNASIFHLRNLRKRIGYRPW